MQQEVKQTEFGTYLRTRREGFVADGKPLSLRRLAQLCDVTPAYLSRVERGLVAPPGADLVRRMANVLNESPDVMLAMAGKVSEDLKSAILARPELFADLIRTLRNAPDKALIQITRNIRDGEW